MILKAALCAEVKNMKTAVSNFDEIRCLLNWNNDDEYYYCQLIKRKKDGTTKFGNKNNDGRIVSTYYFRNEEEFVAATPEIIKICEASGARAGINLNKKSEKRMAKHLLRNLTERVLSEQFNGINALTSRYNGKTCTNSKIDEKIYLIDIDNRNELDQVYEIIEYIDTHGNRKNSPTEIIDCVDTYTGNHLITYKFDTLSFMKQVEQRGLDVSVHKNNPVALYYPAYNAN